MSSSIHQSTTTEHHNNNTNNDKPTTTTNEMTTRSTTTSITSSSPMTTQFFRCSACTSLIQRYMPISDFLRRVDAKRLSQKQGTIPRLVLPQPQSSSSSSSAKSFRTRDAPHNLCILPDGVDSLELAGVRWGEGFEKKNTIQQQQQKHQKENNIDHGLCKPPLPVTLLSSSPSSTPSTTPSTSATATTTTTSAYLSSGPLIIDGLDHHAEILLDLKLDQEEATKAENSSNNNTNNNKEKLIRYGEYHLYDNNIDETDKRIHDKSIKTSRTLYGSKTGAGPVIVHAQPCPLRFDRYCQLGVSKKFTKPSTTTINLNSENQPAAPSSSLSSTLPVTSFVRKLASATVVICRVPKKEADLKDSNKNSKTSSNFDHFVLLTQRQSYMRTFPSFFVVPGGGFDASDGTVENAARRELLEEVSLTFETDNIPESPSDIKDAKSMFSNNQTTTPSPSSTVEQHQNHHSRKSSTISAVSSTASSLTTIADGQWQWEGCWESSFPTHPDHIDIQNAACPVRGHIVFFFSVTLEVPTVEDLPRLKPQSEEVASAKWYRIGHDVDELVENNHKKYACDFGSVPPITEYFQEMKLDPQRVELTLQLEEELYGKKSQTHLQKQRDKKQDVDVDDDKVNTSSETDQKQVDDDDEKKPFTSHRMKITAGTEYFITRICERMTLLENASSNKNKEQEE